MNVLKILNRVYLEHGNLDSVIPFYERVLGEECRMRFTDSKLGLELGQVGPILLIAGSREQLEPVKLTRMTFLVDSITDSREVVIKAGAQILQDVAEVPTGFNLRVRHPDGVIVEYVEHHTQVKNGDD